MNHNREIDGHQDELCFIEETPTTVFSDESSLRWKIIIADDQEEIHNVTKMVLDDFTFKNRGLQFLDAYSGEETKRLARENPDTAFILLDVVMETDDAGLEVIRYVREELKNSIVQIVLNTGQPGQAPEQEVIFKYEINDYKSKTEFNAQKLITCVTSSLRAFSLSDSLCDANKKLNRYRNHLEELVKERTAELEQANEILRNILAASPIGICLVEEKVIRWINEEMQKLFGFESDADYKGKSTQLIYPSEKEYNRVDQLISEKLQANEPVITDASFVRKDGSIFPGNLKISCTDPSHPMMKAILTVSDITWRRQAEQDRMQKERLQGALEVSGSICHELNQPLQYVSGSSELLIMDMAEDDPLYGTICKIKEQVDRMGKITKKLMGITSYKTREYVGGSKIIDLDEASKKS